MTVQKKTVIVLNLIHCFFFFRPHGGKIKTSVRKLQENDDGLNKFNKIQSAPQICHHFGPDGIRQDRQVHHFSKFLSSAHLFLRDTFFQCSSSICTPPGTTTNSHNQSKPHCTMFRLPAWLRYTCAPLNQEFMPFFKRFVHTSFAPPFFVPVSQRVGFTNEATQKFPSLNNNIFQPLQHECWYIRVILASVPSVC